MTTEGMSFAHGINQEMQYFFLSQAERAGQAMGFVPQEQFDSLWAMCQKQAMSIQALTELCGIMQKRLDYLEATLGEKGQDISENTQSLHGKSMKEDDEEFSQNQ